AVVSLVAVLVWDWYFVPPLHRLDPFGDPRDAVALVAFLAVALLVGRIERADRCHEEAVSRSESRWRTLIAAAPIGIVTVDEQGRIVAVNDAYCRLTGYTREELAGAEIGCLIPREQRAAILDEYVQRMAANVHEQWDVPLLTKGGERRTVLSNGVTL